MIRMRKISIKYRYNSVDIILKTLEWLQEKEVRAWAVRGPFEFVPTIYYIYRKDLSLFIDMKILDFWRDSHASADQDAMLHVHNSIADNPSSIFYADNKPYFIGCQTQNIHPL